MRTCKCQLFTDEGSCKLPKRLNYCFSVLASAMNWSIWVYLATQVYTNTSTFAVFILLLLLVQLYYFLLLQCSCTSICAFWNHVCDHLCQSLSGKLTLYSVTIEHVLWECFMYCVCTSSFTQMSIAQLQCFTWRPPIGHFLLCWWCPVLTCLWSDGVHPCWSHFRGGASGGLLSAGNRRRKDSKIRFQFSI